MDGKGNGGMKKEGRNGKGRENVKREKAEGKRG